jgi:hypothetical protein
VRTVSQRKPVKPLSLRKFAAHVGATENAVRKAIKSGRLVKSIGRTAKGQPCIADVELAAAEWTQNASRPNGAEIIPTDTLVNAQREATIERARKLRLDNDLTEGITVEVAKVKREAFESGRTIRKALMNIPARLSAELAAEPDAGRVYSKLEAALREALVTLAEELTAVTA